MLGTQNAQWIDRIDDEIKVDGHGLQVKKAGGRRQLIESTWLYEICSYLR